ncbi:MAG: alpha-1,4-glucan--maltose-1-phosphate maltosyltransferase [Betaproteobacteria bacterium]|nr:alpha-1,4-glucan--maltose-1-phosphate maltosyltransferase [Betaproteobacteria bacterium]
MAESEITGFDGRVRAVIENISPSVDGGRFAAKRIAGDKIIVEADCFADGHEILACMLLWRRESDAAWNETPMARLANDRWRGSFATETAGPYRYTVSAWVDHFLTWRHDFARRVEGEDIRVAAQVGAGLIEGAAQRAAGEDSVRLREWAARLRALSDAGALKALGLDEQLAAIAERYPDRRRACTFPVEYPLVVDRVRARFSTWYEMFPRSASPEPARHGTLRDCEARLPYVAKMGFDVLYLPPIHPIGRINRKGANNALAAEPADVGSPWAVGAAEGGHEALHPELGTMDDFRRLLASARAHGIEIAMDIAFQCTPDHPYVAAHPAWFRWRPDGTVQYAENPPKKYQDIFPFEFESEDWRELWQELAGVIGFWAGEGVRIFRIDNPHTKPFAFWEWAIAELKRKYPEAIFLAEAFTRPKVMHRLAKLGFSQSYTYFAWRNTKRELTEYFTELTRGPGREYFRPNVWPNTPDILTEYLQFGGRPAFVVRLVLAATLAANYGLYGPAYELLEATPREPGSEEYLDSEKYQIRHWDLALPHSLSDLIARVNRVRRENPALQSDRSLRFFDIDNDSMLCYGKATEDLENLVVTVVNLDPHHVQSGWVELELASLGIDAGTPYQMHDLLSGARFLWSGPRNFVRLDPQRAPAHVFALRRKMRTERSFDYFL